MTNVNDMINKGSLQNVMGSVIAVVLGYICENIVFQNMTYGCILIQICTIQYM